MINLFYITSGYFSIIKSQRLRNLINNYKSLCSEFYDLDKPYAPKEVLNFYFNETKNVEQPVLEPMCGTGRFLIPMLEQGIEIEGADASSEMLLRCKLNSENKNLNPVLYHQKIQDIKLPGKYGLIFIPSGSFGLITDEEEISQSLRNLYLCLKKGGKIFIEIETPYGITTDGSFENREVTCRDQSIIKLTTDSSFDIKNNIESIKCEYIKITDDNVTLTEFENIKIKYYWKNEFKELLRSAGFTEIEKLNIHNSADSDNIILFKGVKN